MISLEFEAPRIIDALKRLRTCKPFTPDHQSLLKYLTDVQIRGRLPDVVPWLEFLDGPKSAPGGEYKQSKDHVKAAEFLHAHHLLYSGKHGSQKTQAAAIARVNQLHPKVIFGGELTRSLPSSKIPSLSSSNPAPIEPPLSSFSISTERHPRWNAESEKECISRLKTLRIADPFTQAGICALYYLEETPRQYSMPNILPWIETTRGAFLTPEEAQGEIYEKQPTIKDFLAAHTMINYTKWKGPVMRRNCLSQVNERWPLVRFGGNTTSLGEPIPNFDYK